MYWFRQSQRLGDDDSRDYFLMKAGEAGVTDKSFVASMMKLDPLAAGQPSLRSEFLAGLAPADQDRMRRSYYHWAHLVTPELDTAQFDSGDVAEFARQVRRHVEHELKRQHPMRDLMQENPEMRDAQRERFRQQKREKALSRAGY
jgi:hypothetical protein